MIRSLLRLRFFAALTCATFLATLVACSDHAVTPSLLPTMPQQAPSWAYRNFNNLPRTSGPSIVFDSDQSIILPGTGAQYTFAAHVQGGSGKVTWKSLAPTVVSVDASGKATALAAMGSASIIVSAPKAEDTIATVIIAPLNKGTILVSSSDVVSISPNTANPAKVVLEADKTTTKIRAGDILVSGSTTGLLVKVTSVKRSRSKIEAAVTPSSLAAAFAQMNVQMSGATSRYTAMSENGQLVLRDRYGIERERFSFPSLSCKNLSGGSVAITLSGPSLKFTTLDVTPNLQLVTGGGAVQVFAMTVTMTAKIEAKVGSIEAGGGVKAAFICSADLFSLPIPPFPIGPMLLYPTLDVVGGVAGEISTQATFKFDGPSATASATVTAGITYTGGKWDGVHDLKTDGSGSLGSWPKKPTAKLTGSLGPFVEGQLGLHGCLGAGKWCIIDLFDTSMATANLAGKLAFMVSTPLDYHDVTYGGPTWDLSIVLTVALKADISAGGKLKKLLEYLGLGASIKISLATFEAKFPLFANPSNTDLVIPSSVMPHNTLTLEDKWNCPTLPCIVNYHGDELEFLLFPKDATVGTEFGHTKAVEENNEASTKQSAPGCPADNPYKVRAFLFGDIFGRIELPYPSGFAPFTVICGTPSPSPSPSGPITDYPLDPFYGYPEFLANFFFPPHMAVRHPHTIGNVWFTIDGPNPAIGMITTSGSITHYTTGLSASSDNPSGIAEGPDNNLWFTDTQKKAIGVITTSGTITHLYTSGITGTPQSIAAGPDGNLWFTETSSGSTGKVAKITTSGAVTEYSSGISSFQQPQSIVVGSDNNLWFTEPGNGKIGKVTTLGTITELPLPIGATANYIAAGPDGNLWATLAISYPTSKLGIAKITTAGAVTEYTTGISSNASPIDGIAGGPLNSLWFTESGNGKIGRITTTGTVTEYSTGVTVSGIPLNGIGEGPDGNVWFAEPNAKAIGKLDVSKLP